MLLSFNLLYNSYRSLYGKFGTTLNVILCLGSFKSSVNAQIQMIAFLSLPFPSVKLIIGNSES